MQGKIKFEPNHIISTVSAKKKRNKERKKKSKKKEERKAILADKNNNIVNTKLTSLPSILLLLSLYLCIWSEYLIIQFHFVRFNRLIILRSEFYINSCHLW